MKIKQTLLAILMCCLTVLVIGCAKMDPVIPFKGPRTLDWQEQTVSYSPDRSFYSVKKLKDYNLSYVWWYDTEQGYIKADYDAGTYYTDWFSVKKEGMDIVLSINENTTGSRRQIRIVTTGDDYFYPTALDIEQECKVE